MARRLWAMEMNRPGSSKGPFTSRGRKEGRIAVDRSGKRFGHLPMDAAVYVGIGTIDVHHSFVVDQLFQ
jgi:hypothetical protein